MNIRFLYLLLFVFSTTFIATGQTVVFHENFESPSGADSVAASPSSTWGLSSALAASGSKSDSCRVKLQDTTYLTTGAFSTTGMQYVLLNFDQICKIEFFDAAVIEVSTNNGSSWTPLTGGQYLGTGQFGNIGNKFTSTSYIDWMPTNNNAVPVNSWWKHEIFDISSIASNTSQVKIRFVLKDINGSGPSGNYGWLLDNITVTAAIDELVPPTIVFQTPVIQDSVFSYGPFSIVANISDNSGIDSALLIYSRNGGPNDTVTMIHNYGNVYTGIIDTVPAFSLHDTICYHVWAMDSSLVHNTSVLPALGCNSFIIYNSQPCPGCNYGLTNFPYLESFDQNFTAGQGYPSSPGTLDSLWTRNPSSASNAYMWLVKSGHTSSSGTGPNGDHTSGNGNYLYAEASYGTTAAEAKLYSPCFNLDSIDVPVLEFYYHMYGSAVGELHVDIWYGNSWATDIMTPLTGDQGNQWHKATVNLLNYKGAVTKIRFRALRGSSIAGDIAIDDIKVWEPPQYDAGIVSIDRPVSPANVGLQPVKVTFKNFGAATLNKITVNWQVNGQTKTPFVWTGTLTPGSQADSVNIGNHNFISGPSNIKVWTSAPNDSADGFHYNDTAQTSIIACTAPLHGSFTIGGAAADFMTFDDAIYAIKNCGIDSAIVFYVNQGTYIEQLDIDTITGASSQNTITFTSANGDSTSVLLSYSPANSQSPYVVRFKGASWFTFKNITVSSTSSNYGRLFVFENDASHNTIENCLLKMPQSSNYYCNAGYSTSTSKSEYNSFINNDVKNGYYSFYFYSKSTSKAKGNRFIKNNLHGFRYYGVYLSYQDSFIVRENTMINDTTATSSYPVYAYRGAGAFDISKNNITAKGKYSIYGIRVYYCDATQNNPGTVSNNMIRIIGSSSSPYGLYVYNSNHVNFYYNTILINTSTSNQNGRALYQSSGSNLRFKNNIYCNKSDGYTIYINTPAAIVESDYNDLYTTGQNIAYWSGTGAISSLATLQNVSGKEAHSVSVLPVFVAVDNLHLVYSTLNNGGTPIAGIPDDIDGELRSTTSPAMGADEQPPIPIDAGIAEIISPSASEAEADTVPVTVVLKNFGTDTLNSFTYNYSVNGVIKATQTYNQTLPPMAVDTVSFPDMIISPGHNNICAKTILSTDTNTYNDQLCKYFYGVPITDAGVVSMVTPDSGKCYTSTETLKVIIKNYGSQPINFAQKPLTIHTTVTAPVNTTVPDITLNTGILAVGATTQVTLTTTLDMNHTGDFFFDIWTTVAGDGDPTNDSMETKKIAVFATVVNFPFQQGYENFVASSYTKDPGQLVEGWVQNNPSNNYTWYVGKGSTYTNSTGPAADHTLGTVSGKYCYAEATGYYASTANLVSPCIDLSSMTHPTLRYWYHMYGAKIHSLRVDVYANGIWNYSLGHVMGQQQSSSTDAWKQDIIDLTPFAGQVIKFRFRAIKMIGYEADVAIDDVFIYEPVQKDAGISNNFQKPSTNFAAVGTKQDVEVKIENYGLDTLKDLYVGYVAGNNPPVLEHWTGSIPPYSFQNFQFTTKYTVEPGEVYISAFTSYNGDMNNANDTGKIAFTGVAVMKVPYTDDFEGKNYFVSTGGLIQWQRGTPSKNTFTSAHSGANAWVTSLMDDYLNNSNDYLYTPFFNLSTFPGTYLRFWQRMETQASHDGGFVEYSTDGGNTFMSLGYMNDPAATKWYNTNIGGTHMWSGPDSGWVQSTYNLALIPTSQPVQFRFKFFSNNSVNNFDGWMIDDFEITPNAIAKDAGVKTIKSPAGYTQSGSNVSVTVELKNYGTTTLTQIPVSYRIDNGSPVTQNWMGTLMPDSTTTFTFTSSYQATASYTLETWTGLTGDSHWYNDSTSIEMARDAGVIAIVNPKPVMVWSDTIPVIIQVRNFGNDTITSCDFAYDVNGGTPVTESWTGVLAPGATMLFTFNNKWAVSYGIVNFCTRTILSGDTKSSNDKKCGYISGTIGLPETPGMSFSVSQNVPNPFDNNTLINVKLPHSGEFTVNISDVTGKIVKTVRHKGTKGDNDITINGKSLGAGIYFYKVSFEDQAVIRKMIIVE